MNIHMIYIHCISTLSYIDLNLETNLYIYIQYHIFTYIISYINIYVSIISFWWALRDELLPHTFFFWHNLDIRQKCYNFNAWCLLKFRSSNLTSPAYDSPQYVGHFGFSFALPSAQDAAICECSKEGEGQSQSWSHQVVGHGEWPYHG